jgi:rod shape-determining protein MreC
VVYVDESYAKVLLLSDPNSGVAGIVQRSGAEGFVRGQGDDPLSMQYVSSYQDVSIGDRVVTSGMDGVFPRGFSLGRVMYVNDADQVSMTILLQPAVESVGLQEVLVLTGDQVGPYLSPPQREPDR